jgi:pimeloyl-ACP methyl ester carboxylesterase
VSFVQHLSTILQCGNCGLANRRSFILNIRPINIHSIGTVLGTSFNIMSRFSRIAITALAIAMATTIAAAPGAWSQTSEFARQPTAQPAAVQPVATQPAPKQPAAHHAPLESAAVTAAPSDTGRPYVYLLRGLMNIFSLGMDDLAAKLQRRGVAAGVYEYGQWESLCQDAAARWRSSRTQIVIVGHSLGGDAVIYMANRLGQMGIPVALVVAFDPVHPVPLTGGTTARFVNLYQSNNGWGAAVPRGSGFHGELSNVDLRTRGDISHTSIDKSARLHEIVIGRVLGLGRPAAPKPVVAAPRTGDAAPAAAAEAPAPQPSSDTLRPVLASPPHPTSQTQ